MTQHQSTARKAFSYIYPIFLYYAMVLIVRLISVNLLGARPGLSDEEMGVIFGLAILSQVFAVLFYPLILNVARAGNGSLAYQLFMTMNYPSEFMFISLPLVMLQAEFLPAAMRSPWFTFVVVGLSAVLAKYLRKHVVTPYRDIRRSVWEEEFFRFVCVALAVAISYVLGRVLWAS